MSLSVQLVVEHFSMENLVFLQRHFVEGIVLVGSVDPVMYILKLTFIT